MDRILFIYDKLMTKELQKQMEVRCKFLSFGQTKGKMYFVNDTKKKNVFILPKTGVTTSYVFGGLYLIKEYENYAHKLSSYYYNSQEFVGETLPSDLYDIVKLNVMPIKFASLSDLKKGRYTKGDLVECYSFIGNINNKKIQRSKEKRKYYGTEGMERTSFIQTIQEINELKERRKNNGLE